MLPDDMKAAVVLRDMEELSNAEAAEVIGISVSALKSRLHRGRVLLRKHLDEYLKPVE
ncbi:MAG: RNA polymerase subunit sigma-24, partial [Dehalococcoidia bacterium]|nr:RNA polymerase subunit sigma-24 [Dehalococcoidia bacterium]